MTRTETPLSRPFQDDGSPMWEQINKLFLNARLTLPPIQLRDELVTILAWARYAQALETCNICGAINRAETITVAVPGPPVNWPNDVTLYVLNDEGISRVSAKEEKPL